MFDFLWDEVSVMMLLNVKSIATIYSYRSNAKLKITFMKKAPRIFSKGSAAMCIMAVFCLGLIFWGISDHVHAQANADSPVTTDFEQISDFKSDIVLNGDNSVLVTETVVYNTGLQARHGIYRDIHPYSSDGRYMDITGVSVTDQNGNTYPWIRQSNGGDIRLKIGDPNNTFTGNKTYVITYQASNAVSHLKDVDEIYWNVTGNTWTMPIESAEATVYLPQASQGVTAISATQSACYYGPSGSATRCDKPGTVATNFKSPAPLDIGSGMTVAVGFPKGLITAYSTADNVKDVFYRYVYLLIAILLPLLVFIFMFLRWFKVGRDPKGKGVIIPEYDVPDDITPAEMSCILYQKMRPKDIPAEIVYLATKGYIKIRQTEDKLLGFIKTTDYEFEAIRDYSDLPNQSDIKLLDGIFEGDRTVGNKAKLSSLMNKFYKDIPGISNGVVDSMLAKGYYSNLKKSKISSFGHSAAAAMFVLGIISVQFIAMSGNSLGSGVIPLAISLAVTIVMIAIFSQIMPAKTAKGVETKEYILGLKMYLQIAEKDRLAFNNAPAKKPEIFEKLLPYAMVLGVDKAWAKEFQDIYLTPPNWYEGYSGGPFNAIAFTNSLSSFSLMAASSMGAAPGGGGSGGGGFSGGGGGGGGGGGW